MESEAGFPFSTLYFIPQWCKRPGLMSWIYQVIRALERGKQCSQPGKMQRCLLALNTREKKWNRIIFSPDTAGKLPKRKLKVCKCDWVLNAKDLKPEQEPGLLVMNSWWIPQGKARDVFAAPGLLRLMSIKEDQKTQRCIPCAGFPKSSADT